MNDPIGIGVVGCGASVWMHGPAINANRDTAATGGAVSRDGAICEVVDTMI